MYGPGADDEDNEVDDTFLDEDCEVEEEGGHLPILGGADSEVPRKKRKKIGSGRL